jgi:thioredoxin reductase
MDAGISRERPSPRTIATRCCIVGGGPAGMMLGNLLGRAGVDTLVISGRLCCRYATVSKIREGTPCIPGFLVAHPCRPA